MNLPNKITLSRIFLIPLFMVFAIPLPKYLFINESINLFFENYGITIATFIFLLASVTDGIDGYIARKYKMVTNLGVFLDPIADKLMVSSALLVLVELNKISIWVAFIIIAREFIVTGIRLIAAKENKVIAANNLGKVKTIVQIVAIVFALTNNYPLSLINNFPLYQILIIITITITIYSGWVYIRDNKNVLK